MGWVRLSDDFYDNGKLSEVNPLCISLYLASIAWCNRNLTDGLIPKAKAHGLLDFTGICIDMEVGSYLSEEPLSLAPEIAKELVKAGALHESGHDCDGRFCEGVDPGPRKYLIHDYLEFQRSKEQIKNDRTETAKRVAEWRERQKNAKTNAASNGVSTTPPTPTPTPTPTTGGTQVGTDLALVEVQETPAKAGAKTAKRRARIPDNYVPPMHVIDSMIKELGCTKDDLLVQHRNFCDYWQGQGKPMADWDATWRRWMRTAAERGNVRSKVRSTGTTNDDKVKGWMEMGNAAAE